MRAAHLVKDFKLAAVCSRDIDNAKAFAQKYSGENWTNDYRNFLNYKLDAVYVAVPNAMHKDISIFFLKNKIPVLCEKPLASNIEEVAEMINAARANNTLLAEAIIPLYTEAFKIVKDNLYKLGNIRRAILGMGQYSSRYDQYRAGKVLNAFKPELSNGSIMDIGIYPLSFAVGLFGKPESLFANAFHLESKVDGLGSIVMAYPDKEVIVMHSKITDQLFLSEIQGEDGTLQFDDIFYPKTIIYKPRLGEKIILYKEEQETSLYYELCQFIEAVKKNRIEVLAVSHSLIIDVHSLLTKAREKSKVVFPADLKK